MNIDTIHIALAANQKYFSGLLVTAYSIAKNASKDAPLVFHILDGGIEDADFQVLENAVMRVHAASNIIRHKINEMEFADFPDYLGNKMTYARYLLPSLLPDCSHVIYCDVDFLWRADIAELWKERTSGYLMYGVRDFEQTIKNVNQWMQSNHLPPFSQYFCAGLSFMNLNKIREQHIIKKCSEFLRIHPDIAMGDQTPTNYICAGQIKFLDPQWMILAVIFRGKFLKKPAVLHYAGPERMPWMLHSTLAIPPIDDLEILWHRYYADARRISLFKSLCNNYTKWQIIRSITVLKLCRIPGIRPILFRLLRYINRPQYPDAILHKEQYVNFESNAQAFNSLTIKI